MVRVTCAELDWVKWRSAPTENAFAAEQNEVDTLKRDGRRRNLVNTKKFLEVITLPGPVSGWEIWDQVYR